MTYLENWERFVPCAGIDFHPHFRENRAGSWAGWSWTESSLTLKVQIQHTIWLSVSLNWDKAIKKCSRVRWSNLCSRVPSLTVRRSWTNLGVTWSLLMSPTHGSHFQRQHSNCNTSIFWNYDSRTPSRQSTAADISMKSEFFHRYNNLGVLGPKVWRKTSEWFAMAYSESLKLGKCHLATWQDESQGPSNGENNMFFLRGGRW